MHVCIVEAIEILKIGRCSMLSPHGKIGGSI